MPIRFRCTHCARLLGIATRKAGTETTCPHCGSAITVPAHSGDDAKTEHINLDDVDAMLGNVATERMVKPATQMAQPGAAPLSALPAPLPTENDTEETETAPPPIAKVSAAPAKARVAPPPVPKVPAKAVPKASDDRPLFERDMDEILGLSDIPVELDQPKPARVTGADAMSLGEPPRAIVLTPQQATLLTGAVVVLLGVAFAAGYFLAR
ncbi:hypothetical protein J8F10_06805 [Gemmata sp. G18]|uniref:Zinc ribbon domain-containing protein n=1 Tax=Gemmata palustris TaxID=2822762 RepID=A0ABS5BMU4_9BACT|nr:hypothetical protein [Gemmata palustris]MBP3954990.1 hypothetical protein [Gemmata palustris]